MEVDSRRPGTILKIKLQNFVSYNKLSYKPSSLVNILLAPNGAGKSSLLSAIILGLGGKPNIIGKSNQIQDFIRYGKEEAKIRIDLFDPNESSDIISICRAIKRNGTSIWIINKKKVGLKQIEEVMTRLNIQVDSLCQVLPQERVQDFAKMNSLALLENVQKVIAGDLYTNYNNLLELRKSLEELSSSIDKKAVMYQDEVTKYTRLEKDVEAIKEKKMALKSVTACKQKLAWTLFKSKEEEQNKVNVYLIEAKRKLQCFEKDLDPLKKSIQRLDSKLLSSNEVVSNKRNKVNMIRDKLKKSINVLKISGDQIKHIKDTLQRKISESSNLDSQIAEVESKIVELSQILAKENVNELTNQVNNFESCIKQKMGELHCLSEKKEEVKKEQIFINNTLKMLENKLEKANSVSKKRLNMISSRSQDACKGYTWLNQYRDQFEAGVYGPILLEINITQPQAAKYFEFIINYRDLISFLTETTQDTNSLLSALNDKDIKINCAHCDPPDRDLREIFRPTIPLEQIRSLGFDCYLIDLLNGPSTVLKHLCNLYKLHLIPVALNPKKINKEAVARHEHIISRYFVGDEFYIIKKSKYNNDRISSVKLIRPARLLADSIDKDLIGHIQRELYPKREALSELENEILEIDDTEKTLKTELNDLRNKKKLFSSKLQDYRSTTVRLRRVQEESLHLQNSVIDIQKEEKEVQNKISTILHDNLPKMNEVLNYHKEYSEDIVACKLAALDYEAVKKLKEDKVKELSQYEEDKRKLLSDCEDLKKALQEVKVEATQLLNKAKELTDGLVMGEDKFAKLYDKAFARLPQDIESIKNKIYSFEAKAKCLDNPLQEQHIREFETAKELAENLNSELQKLKEELTLNKKKFDTIHSIWMPQINDVVSQINYNFSRFFQKINCVGEVSLHQDENKDAVEKFGIEIRVKFRNDTELQILDQYIQSGGERALTTAVFLLSLQRLSTLPFRCVDEINQGMDKFNERRVYNLLFNTISDASSQYFLLTPKFLPKVPFPKICTIFNVYNSHHMIERTVVSSDSQVLADRTLQHLAERNRSSQADSIRSRNKKIKIED